MQVSFKIYGDNAKAIRKQVEKQYGIDYPKTVEVKANLQVVSIEGRSVVKVILDV